MVNDTSRPVDCNNLASYAFRSNSCWDVQFVVSKAAALLVRDQKGEQIALLGVIGEMDAPPRDLPRAVAIWTLFCSIELKRCF
jgi:hypothetical protein